MAIDERIILGKGVWTRQVDPLPLRRDDSVLLHSGVFVRTEIKTWEFHRFQVTYDGSKMWPRPLRLDERWHWVRCPSVQVPLEGRANSGCLNCPGKPHVLDTASILAVGFGMVNVKKDSGYIWTGDNADVTLKEIENAAQCDPHHDWQVEFHSPMYDATYQRHGPKAWVLIKQGMGFA